MGADEAPLHYHFPPAVGCFAMAVENGREHLETGVAPTQMADPGGSVDIEADTLRVVDDPEPSAHHIVCPEIARERAIALLNPTAARVLELEAAGSSHTQIGAAVGLSKSGVHGALRRARAHVASCTTAILAGGTDYTAMTPHTSKNVLQFLVEAGVEIPAHAGVEVLKKIAVHHLQRMVTVAEADKEMAVAAYRLQSAGTEVPHDDISRFGISAKSVYRAARRTVAAVALAHSKPAERTLAVDEQPPNNSLPKLEGMVAGEVLASVRAALRQGDISMNGGRHGANRAYAQVLLPLVEARMAADRIGSQDVEVAKAVRFAATGLVRYAVASGENAEGNIERDVEVTQMLIEDAVTIRTAGVRRAVEVAMYSSAEEVQRVIDKYRAHPLVSRSSLLSLLEDATVRPEQAVHDYLQRVERARSVFSDRPVVTDSVIREACLRMPQRWAEVVEEFATARERGLFYSVAWSEAQHTVGRRKAQLKESERQRQYELPDEPEAAMQTIRAFAQRNPGQMTIALEASKDIADGLYRRLSDDPANADIVSYFGDELASMCRIIARPLLRYRTAYRLPESPVEVAVARQYLTDVAVLRRYGLRRAERVAVYSSPETLAELYDLYPDCSHRFINMIADTNTIDPAAALEQHAARMARAQGRFAGQKDVTIGVIRSFSGSNPESFKDTMEKYAASMVTARRYLQDKPMFSELVLHRIARQIPEDIIVALKQWSVRAAELRRRHPNRQIVPPTLLNSIATLKPSSPDISQEEHIDELDAELERYLDNLRGLKQQYRHEPLVTYEVLVRCVASRRGRPGAAIEGYLSNMEQFAAEFSDDPDVVDNILQNYAADYCNNYQSARQALLRWKDRLAANRQRFRDTPEIDDDMLKDVSYMWVKRPETGLAILTYRRRMGMHSLVQALKPGGTLTMLGVIAAQDTFAVSDTPQERSMNRVQGVLDTLDDRERVAVMIALGVESPGGLGMADDDLSSWYEPAGAGSITDIAERTLVRLSAEASGV